MGGKLIMNDTLRISKAQGFPDFLDIQAHLKQPYDISLLDGKTFTFIKPDIRAYQPHPIRVSWVEDIDGKWLYWGMISILRTTHDFEAGTTSGIYRVVKLFRPEEMKLYFDCKDGVESNNFFRE